MDGSLELVKEVEKEGMGKGWVDIIALKK